MSRTRSFPADRQSIPAARRFATSVLADLPPDLLEAVELMVSELTTNCVRHVGAGFGLTIRRTPTEVRIEVSDRGAGRPEMRFPAPDEPTGRGLRIVDMLSRRWGVEQHPTAGKTVWFTVTAEASPETRQRSGASRRPAGHGAEPSRFAIRRRSGCVTPGPEARARRGAPAGRFV